MHKSRSTLFSHYQRRSRSEEIAKRQPVNCQISHKAKRPVEEQEKIASSRSLGWISSFFTDRPCETRLGLGVWFLSNTSNKFERNISTSCPQSRFDWSSLLFYSHKMHGEVRIVCCETHRRNKQANDGMSWLFNECFILNGARRRNRFQQTNSLLFGGY